MSRDVIAHISTKNLVSNFQLIKSLIPSQTRVLAMLKANAYGHGAVEIAQALPDADAIGMVSFDIAIKLRESGIQCPIVMMQGFVDLSEILTCVKYQLTPVIHSEYQIDLLRQTPVQSPLSYWLKLNTGMNRLGFDAEGFRRAYRVLSSLPKVLPSPVLMTHLSSAGENEEFSRRQIHSFDEVVLGFSHSKSLCNSAGLLHYPGAHLDWVRPGIMLYGISPVATKTSEQLGLKPVMTMKGRLIAIRRQKEGDLIGYSGYYKCKQDMDVGVVNVGYGDGFPRAVGPGAVVLIKGQRCEIVGKVSMDMLTVNLTSLGQSAKVGDPVTLWGEGLPVEQLSSTANMLPYELVTGVTSRVKFIYS